MYPELFKRLLNRDLKSHKYSFGHVLVIGGSPGMVGAPYMTAMAALRTGAGLVTIASFSSVIDKLEARTNEIMTLRISPGDTASSTLETFLHERHVSVVVMGPGANPELSADLLRLLPTLNVPVVVDAGALNALSENMVVLSDAAANNVNVILTPHHGEYRRLIGHELPDAVDELKSNALDFARRYHVTLILKSHHTLIVHPDGRSATNEGGNPGMATAGTGDVLSGILAGLLAQNVPTQEAAEAGVYVHGVAGDIAAHEKTQPGMIATDLIECIPIAFARLG